MEGINQYHDYEMRARYSDTQSSIDAACMLICMYADLFKQAVAEFWLSTTVYAPCDIFKLWETAIIQTNVYFLSLEAGITNTISITKWWKIFFFMTN